VNFGIKASTVRQFLISSGLPSKKAIQIVNQTLNELKVEKHPDKTFIGRIAKGFDFLGYSFEPKGLSIAPKTLANFLDRMTQLYEQGVDHRRIGKRKGERQQMQLVKIENLYRNYFTQVLQKRS